MTTWIGLIRGINVGGNNILPMASLKRDLESLGCQDVRTYIQSGNVVLNSNAKSANSLADKIANCIHQNHGFRPEVVLLTPHELKAAREASPFPQAAAQPKSLHFFFPISSVSNPNMDALNNLRLPNEQFELTEKVLYLYAPDGIARSKLATNISKHLGVSTTARNLRTVEKLLEIAGS